LNNNNNILTYDVAVVNLSGKNEFTVHDMHVGIQLLGKLFRYHQ